MREDEVTNTGTRVERVSVTRKCSEKDKDSGGSQRKGDRATRRIHGTDPLGRVDKSSLLMRPRTMGTTSLMDGIDDTSTYG